MKKTILSFVVAVSVIIVACEKKDTIPVRYSAIPGSNTNIKFLNMSPGSPQVNFFTNGTKASAIAATSTGAEAGIVYNTVYPAAIGYATAPSGSLKIDAIVTAASTISPGATLMTTTQTFDAGKFYTVVMLDTFTSAKALVVQDDPTVPDAAKAYYRVANFLANSPVKVEVIKTSTGTPFSKTYASVAAKTVLNYDTLSAGSGQIYKILLRNATTDARLDSVVNFTPALPKKYTFYVRGGNATTGTTRPLISTYINF